MELYKHQHYALQRAKQGNLALFHDCGCGKTLTAIEIIKHYGGKALVVCPLSIIDAAWIEDCQKFAPELSVISLHSEIIEKKDRKVERKMGATRRKERLAEDHDIYVVNFELFKIMYKEIVAKEFNVLIVDESSRIKEPRSQQTMAILSTAGICMYGAKKKGYICRRPIPHRYVLSGTPAPNGEIEYWPQIMTVTGRGNKVFNDNYFAFRGMWFADKYAKAPVKFQDWYLPPERRPGFIDKMTPFCDVVKKSDAIDLPAQVHEHRHVALDSVEMKAYRVFKQDLMLQFKDTEVLASNALTEIMKLRQLTSGFVYSDEGVQVLGTSKMKELDDLLDDIGRDKQVLIWANFRHEIQMLLDNIPNSEALWGHTTDRTGIVQRFKSGETQYLIANPQSAGHGLTFVNCCDMVYFSLNYSYELLKQSQDRIHRIGQGNKCTYYYLIAKGTIDEVIYKTLTGKKNLSETVLNHLKGYSL